MVPLGHTVTAVPELFYCLFHNPLHRKEGRQDLWRNGQQTGKMMFCQKHQVHSGPEALIPCQYFHVSSWAPSASSVEKEHFKVWFICPGSDACFSTRWIALLVSPPPPCYLLRECRTRRYSAVIYTRNVCFCSDQSHSWYLDSKSPTYSSTWHHQCHEA